MSDKYREIEIRIYDMFRSRCDLMVGEIKVAISGKMTIKIYGICQVFWHLNLESN